MWKYSKHTPKKAKEPKRGKVVSETTGNLPSKMLKLFITLEKNFANENENKTSSGKGGKADNKEMESSKESTL